MRNITIYYKTKDVAVIRMIQERFGFPHAISINGTWEVAVKGEDWEELLEVERMGYVEIRHNVNNNIFKNKIKL